MWTQFHDMYSGGSCKQKPFDYIYIEAPEDVAREVFILHFGHDPDDVTCDCCGEDYAVEDYDTLEEATAYQRRGYGKPTESLEDYIARGDVLLIYEETF